MGPSVILNNTKPRRRPSRIRLHTVEIADSSNDTSTLLSFSLTLCAPTTIIYYCWRPSFICTIAKLSIHSTSYLPVKRPASPISTNTTNNSNANAKLEYPEGPGNEKTRRREGLLANLLPLYLTSFKITFILSFFNIFFFYSGAEFSIKK